MKPCFQTFLLAMLLYGYLQMKAQPITYLPDWKDAANSSGSDSSRIRAIYLEIDTFTTRPPYDLFYYGMIGHQKLTRENYLMNDSILTLIDLRFSSNTNRLWIINLKGRKVLYNTLVAHGKNSSYGIRRVASRASRMVNCPMPSARTGGSWYPTIADACTPGRSPQVKPSPAPRSWAM